MSEHVTSSLLRCVFDLATTEEFLGVGTVIEDDTKSSSHVDSVSHNVEVDVLSAVGASVSIDVLEVVLFLRWVVADFIVVGWLSDLTNPWLDSH